VMKRRGSWERAGRGERGKNDVRRGGRVTWGVVHNRSLYHYKMYTRDNNVDNKRERQCVTAVLPLPVVKYVSRYNVSTKKSRSTPLEIAFSIQNERDGNKRGNITFTAARANPSAYTCFMYQARVGFLGTSHRIYPTANKDSGSCWRSYFRARISRIGNDETRCVLTDWKKKIIKKYYASDILS
jgi:hypothetical protein